MASFTPVDVVRLAPVFRHRAPDEEDPRHHGRSLRRRAAFPGGAL
jgi:hypothetical protein